MRFHVEMHVERLVRERGIDAVEARRQALVAFGGVEKYREQARDVRGPRWLDAVIQDARLAVRMLLKFPALTAIGGFALAVGIAIGAASFEAISETLAESIPIDQGDRLVAIQFATDAQGNPERRVWRDFLEWRETVVTVRQLSAFRSVTHNLTIGDRLPEAVRMAQMTASGFDVARTAPALGRYLVAADEVPGASPVIVIGDAMWKDRFGGATDVIGRVVSLGGVAHTIVGVMPEAFRFPVNHDYWIPLQAGAAEFERLEGPRLFVFGRLADGATLARARAELATVGQRTAAAHPELYGRLRLDALPYPREHVEIDRPEIVWSLRLVQLLFGSLLVLVAANLAIVVYARTVTRLGEIAVRSALGASRARLLLQLFIEAMALSLFGAALGLMIADASLTWMGEMLRPIADVPFWITLDLSAATIVYALALAIVAALIVGVLPGLRSTGRQVRGNLRTQSAGGGRPLGALWTSLIVTQVAVSAAILPVALYVVAEVTRMEFSAPAFPAEEFLLAQIDAPDRQRAIIERLEREPAIRGVTYSTFVPGFEGSRRLVLEKRQPSDDDRASEVNTLGVGPDVFEIYEARLLAGRTFTDADAGTNAVIVNRTFAVEVLENDALGRRFTFAPATAADGAPSQVYEIVGVIDDFPAFPSQPMSAGQRTIYRPATIGVERANVLTIRFRAPVTAEAVARVRGAVAEVDPWTPLRDVTTLTDFQYTNRSVWWLISLGLSLVTGAVLLLSAAGIYALMSFTVAQRTREIGIRAALGANPRRILAGVFARVFLQIAVGLTIGTLLTGTLIVLSVELRTAALLFGAVASVIIIVGAAAAIGPARRGLRIDPIEALRIDA